MDKYDVIIVGTGVAGLFTALSVAPNYKLLLISKDKIENSDSYLAQGGICTLKEPADFDSFLEDTLRAGRYENNQDSVKVMIENSPMIMDRLVEYGVKFDINEDGTYEYTREGAHSTYRILHHKDVTGKEITNKLLNNVRERENITLKEYTKMLDFIIEDNVCHGVVIKEKDAVRAVYAKQVVLATGGIGGLFTHSTNFRHITGDSFALALRHGVKLQNINYIQIHPTTLYEEAKNRKFLISESVRGEGGILLNKKGERFVDELLPRDVVTEAIRKQMDEDGRPFVMLSIKHMPKEEITRRFPNIYRHCLEVGYDLSKEDIPVTPAQHYLMGGILADTYGRTSVSRLFAVGETACNGVHGANRLASNSLLESLVFSERAGWIISEETENIEYSEPYISLEEYEDIEAWDEKNRQIIMEEIKRRDGDFYDKWCDK
ncbi:MAG: L-aspartate oxidase [Clostridium sp.]|nr:L-aspartate oxidase [Clostridium sp.]MCM1208841.1 L-aspartate oxidase [Ruminococcus sp.]